MPAVYLLHQEAGKKRQRREQRHLQIALPRKTLENCGQPERQAVISRKREKITQRQENNVAMAQRFRDRKAMSALLRLLFLAELSGNPFALVAAQPIGLPRPVGEIKDRDDAKDNRGNAFENEQPSPAAQSKPGDAQQIAGERRADHERERIRGTKTRDRLGAILVSEPVRQIDDHRWKEAGLGRSNEKAHQIELPGGVYEGHQHRQQPPGNENARNPAASAPAFGDQGAGNFQQEITDEENSGSEADDVVAEAQVVWHLQG